MKIAVLVHNLTGGGAERVASLWVNGFYKEGHQVSVILSDNKSPRTYAIPEEVKVYSIDIPFRNRFLRYAWTKLKNKDRQKKLHCVFEEIQPDVVIGVIVQSAPLLFAAKGDMQFKVIGTDHNAYDRPEDAPLTKYQQWLKFELNKRFDIVTVLTQADKDFIGNKLNNVLVLPNPLTFEPLKQVPPKKKVILASGRLEIWKTKGFDVLIKAWGLISIKYPDWKLQIAGTGRAKHVDLMKQFIRESNVIGSTELLGFCNDVKSLYQQSAVFVLSSRSEGFGMVLTEAMSQGCACIACDFRGRQREIIRTPEEGIICATDNVNELANAMERLIVDDCLRERLQRNALIRSEYFSLENTMKRWNDIFKQLNLL